MIFANTLPKIKTFLRPAHLKPSTLALVVRLMVAFLHHPGRMSASQAAEAIRSQARHRAQVVRPVLRPDGAGQGLGCRTGRAAWRFRSGGASSSHPTTTRSPPSSPRARPRPHRSTRR